MLKRAAEVSVDKLRQEGARPDKHPRMGTRANPNVQAPATDIFADPQATEALRTSEALTPKVGGKWPSAVLLRPAPFDSFRLSSVLKDISAVLVEVEDAMQFIAGGIADHGRGAPLQNTPVIEELERLASVAAAEALIAPASATPMWMVPNPAPAAPLLPMCAALMRDSFIDGLGPLEGFTTFVNQSNLWSTQMREAPCADMPFYAGHKSKDTTESNRLLFEHIIAARNASRPFEQPVIAQGPVALEKLSIVEGNGAAYVVSGKIVQGMAGKFRGAISLATGELLGVKELRSRRAPPPKIGRKSNTVITRDAVAHSELNLLAQVSRNLVVREVVEYQGKVYIFMPWMAGDACKLALADLSDSERRCVGRSLAHQVAGDLEACHKAGFIHHDLKLSNILWNGDGAMAVSDFGLARRIEASRMCKPGGTPGMIAPEIVAREAYGRNSDVWSLGVTYFEFLLEHQTFPLTWRGMDRAALACAHQMNTEFFDWRTDVSHPDGTIEADRIVASGGFFGTYFTEALSLDSVMTLMFLQHVLAPARERETSTLLRERLAREAGLGPFAQSAVRAATHRIADADAEKRNIVGALEARFVQIKSMV